MYSDKTHINIGTEEEPFWIPRISDENMKMYLSDECGHWHNPKLPKTTSWKPEVWHGYNKKGELIYNKFDEEE